MIVTAPIPQVPSVGHLFDYGIMQEQSDIRAHVCVEAQAVYVFKTENARRILRPETRTEIFPERTAKQAGVSVVTATGWLVPWKKIEDIRQILLTPERLSGFSADKSESLKGRLAVAIVEQLLRAGRFPLWLDAAESEDQKIQIKGTDVVVWAKKRIQVKCDYRGGSSERGGTGNLFLQSRECNPLGKY